MKAYFAHNVAEAYESIIADIWYEPDFVTSPRGMEVKEIRDCVIEIEDPMVNLFSNVYRSSPERYIAAEFLWYLSGTNNPSYIENYASLWKGIHNPDGTVNSAYGNLIFNEKNEHKFTQYQWVIESLKKDRDSRQAFMHFNKPTHQFLENKDQVCTLQALFHIRNDKLYMTVNMRSNDVILGFMTDWCFFSILQYHVYLHMKKYYPEITMGSYTHISHSMHLYERHYEVVKNMVDEDIQCIPRNVPHFSEPVINEDGSFKEKYKELFEPILRGEKPDYTQVYSNELIDWCLSKLQ